MSGDHGDAAPQRQFEQQRIAQFVAAVAERAFIASMGQQGQSQLPQAVVERDDSLVRRVDMHDAGDPLDQHCPLVLSPLQTFEGVVAMGIDAGSEEQVVVSGNRLRQVIVGNVYLRSLPVQVAGLVDHSVQCQHYRPGYRLGRRDLVRQLPYDDLVSFALQLLQGDVECGQVEGKLVAVAHRLGNEAAALAGTDARRMHVHVDVASCRIVARVHMGGRPEQVGRNGG